LGAPRFPTIGGTVDDYGADLADVDVVRKPVVPRRYAWADHWTHAWTPIYQPTVYGRTLKELPRYGVNGVYLGLPVIGDLPRYSIAEGYRAKVT